MFTLSVTRDPAELEATHVQHAALRRSYSNIDCDGSAPAAAAKPIAYSISHDVRCTVCTVRRRRYAASAYRKHRLLRVPRETDGPRMAYSAAYCGL